MTTAERTYTTVDKSEWGPGDWQDEPDKIQWVDETTGLDCLIVRGPMGALCGYVGVPPEHPWHGRDYSKGSPIEEDPDGSYTRDTPGCLVDVHGGLTYADRCQEGEDESVGVCHVPQPGRPADVWWFGFDCAHSGDIAPVLDLHMVQSGRAPIHEPYAGYRTVRYVRRQCESLAERLAAVA